MFTDHSALKYLVNKLVLGGRICRWLILFEEYDFEIMVNPERMNTLSDAQLLSIRNIVDHFAEIVQFLSIGVAPSE